MQTRRLQTTSVVFGRLPFSSCSWWCFGAIEAFASWLVERSSGSTWRIERADSRRIGQVRFDVRASLDDVVAYSCAVQPLIRWQYALAKTRPQYVLQSPWAAIRHRLLFKPLPVPRGIVIDVGDESMLISLGSNDSPPPMPHCLRTIGIRFEDRPYTTREIDVLF
jgi:hypothetical protein